MTVCVRVCCVSARLVATMCDALKGCRRHGGKTSAADTAPTQRCQYTRDESSSRAVGQAGRQAVRQSALVVHTARATPACGKEVTRRIRSRNRGTLRLMLCGVCASSTAIAPRLHHPTCGIALPSSLSPPSRTAASPSSARLCGSGVQIEAPCPLHANMSSDPWNGDSTPAKDDKRAEAAAAAGVAAMRLFPQNSAAAADLLASALEQLAAAKRTILSLGARIHQLEVREARCVCPRQPSLAERLVADLLRCIFAHLDLREMLPAARTCHEWYSAALQERSRRMHCELPPNCWSDLASSPLARLHVTSLPPAWGANFASLGAALSLASLTFLSVYIDEVSPVELSQMLQLPLNLRSFSLGFGCTPADSVLASLFGAIAAGRMSLRRLALGLNPSYGRPAPSPAVAQLFVDSAAQCTRLRRLSLNIVTSGTCHLAPLLACTQLHALHLNRMQLDPTQAMVVRELGRHGLRELQWQGPYGAATNADMAMVRRTLFAAPLDCFPALRFFDTCITQPGEVSQLVAIMPNLQHVGGLELSDALAVRTLLRLPLQRVSFEDAERPSSLRIHAAAQPALFVELPQCSSLTELILCRMKVTWQQGETMLRSMPQLCTLRINEVPGALNWVLTAGAHLESLDVEFADHVRDRVDGQLLQLVNLPNLHNLRLCLGQMFFFIDQEDEWPCRFDEWLPQHSGLACLALVLPVQCSHTFNLASLQCLPRLQSLTIVGLSSTVNAKMRLPFKLLPDLRILNTTVREPGKLDTEERAELQWLVESADDV